MAALITGAGDIPPDMIWFPDGHEMPLVEFYREHGDDLRPYADAQVIVVSPGLKVPDEIVEAEKALVIGLTGTLILFVTRSSKAAVWGGPIIGSALAGDVTRWVNRHIEHGRIIRIYTIRELFFPLDRQRAQSDLVAGR